MCSRRKAAVGQRELFAAHRTGRKKSDDTKRDSLPILYARKPSYSALATFATCERRYFHSYPGTWWGWETGAPKVVQKAYWQKKLSPWQAWAGGIVHDFVRDLLWAKIDRAIPRQTGITAPTEKELAAVVRQRFEEEWRQSRSWDWRTFKKAQRQKEKPVWLSHHESGEWPAAAAADQSHDRRWKRMCWNWIERSVNMVLAHRREFTAHTTFEHWLVIEGFRLDRGRIPTDGDTAVAQATLRKKDIFPEVPLTIDGELWALQVILDLLVVTPEDEYIIIDFKTGKDKYKNFHRAQLEQYAACVLKFPKLFIRADLPPVTEENLRLRVVYTNPKAKKPWYEWRVHRGDTARFLWSTRNRIHQLRRCHLRLNELTDEEREDLRRLLPQEKFCGPHGLFKADGKTLRHGVPPDSLVALPHMFPPTQAEKGNANMCKFCNALPLCKEGQLLVARAAQQ